MIWRRLLGFGTLCGFGITCALAGSAWMGKVPATDRVRANPYAGRKKAAAAGARLFAEHCAQCHGADALGKRGRPGLRSEEVQKATDGEIFWLLKNGSLRRGMPSWSSLPEPSRWQIITYLKSLGESGKSESAHPPKENK